MGQDAAERTSLNQRRSSCFARSASLSSRPPLSAPPLSLRPRHRPGDAAAGSVASMADFMRDGTIGVLATAAGRAGAIFIRTAASVPSDSRQQLGDNARLLRRGRVSLLTNRPASVTPRSARTPRSTVRLLVSTCRRRPRSSAAEIDPNPTLARPKGFCGRARSARAERAGPQWGTARVRAFSKSARST
jgi:hypothetical protein